MNARKRIAATLAMLAAAATLSLTAAGTANAVDATCPAAGTTDVHCDVTVKDDDVSAAVVAYDGVFVKVKVKAVSLLFGELS